MNILSKVWNAIAPGTPAALTATAAPAAPTVTPEAFRNANPHADLEPWQVTMSLWVANSTWRGKEFLATERPTITKRMVDKFLTRAGEIATPADIDRLRPLYSRQELIKAKLDE